MNINIKNSSLEFCCGLPEQFPKSDKPQIVFSGRSNVGKSSLINKLLGRNSLARVSSSPGKTITVNFYDIDKKLHFVDLPGYGYAKRSDDERRRLSLLGDGYFQLCSPRLVIQLVDMKVGPTADDMTMLEWLSHMEIPFIVVATKSDKLNKTQRITAIDKIPVDPEFIIPFSALSGEGKDEIWSRIFKYADKKREV